MISLKLLSAINIAHSDDELLDLIDEIAGLLEDGTIVPQRVCGDLIESLALTSEGISRLPPKLPRLPDATA
jgi:hypothetical protein